MDIVWPNHKPCELLTFSRIILETAKILLTHSEDWVVVVHCLGGKGRTGSLINCLLWLSGLFESMEQANSYYLSKRKVNVTYPSQIRYMKLFAEFMERGMGCLDLSRKRLKSFQVSSGSWYFMEDRTFALKIYDYSRKNRFLYQKSVSVEINSPASSDNEIDTQRDKRKVLHIKSISEEGVKEGVEGHKSGDSDLEDINEDNKSKTDTKTKKLLADDLFSKAPDLSLYLYK